MKRFLRPMETVLTVRPLRRWLRRKIISSKILKAASKSERPVIIYVSDFDFTYPLVQRPHQMLRLLAKAGYPVTCCANIKHLQKDVDNLYLIPDAVLRPLIDNEELDKILFFSNGTPIADYRIKDGCVSFYEIIDDYELFGNEEHVKNRIAMFKKITNLPNTWTLVSANTLYDKAVEYGAPKERIVFSKNAVNIEDFCSPPLIIPQAMKSIVAKGKPIIGYYGALTVRWFDFDLMLELLRLHPEWEFVFIGLIYNDPKTQEETEERIANLRKYENFTYIPPIKYEEIPSYAYNFSVAVIPFQINKITKGTNPVKLFEYMAMGLPIVTTPMPECQLYESVITADGVGEFSLAVANAIPLKGDHEYQKTLRREASENTWAARIDDMLSIIKKYNAPRPLLLDVYDRNRDWITRNTIPEEGVIVVKSMTNNAYEGTAYPEVSGYFIPTLLNWGYRDLAAQYAKWLLTIQHDDGSWYDCFDTLPHVFDTGQILKGLIAIQPIMPNAKNAILSGCDWIIRQIDDKGKLQSPHGNLWAIPTCSDLIHLYCLSPILKAGEMFDRPEYIAAVNKVVSYYKANDMDGLLDFHTLSHFYAYIVEALVDLGEADLAKRAMENVAKLQRPDGSVPAYKDVNWLCSTGLFQFAVIWYKLGEKDRADRAFDAACRLQEKSGGWRGSYGEGADYSRDEEISWANKYFMDAMALKISAHFAATACEDTILGDGAYKLVDEIGDNDGRLRLVLDTIQSIGAYSVLDVGCGFGRILKNIKKMNRNIYLCGVDISEAIVSKLPAGEIEGKVGSLLQIPYEDNYFDFVTTTEALEHAVDIENAVKELVRVTKPGGHIQIIDKNIKCWGMYKTPDWEQWFDKNELAGLLRKNGCNVSVTENIPYDDSDGKNGLFIGWLAEKRKPGFLRSLNRHRRSLRKKKREQKKKRRLESAIEQTMDLVQSSSVSKYYKTYRKHEKHYWEKAVVWLCDHVLSMRGDITVLDIGCAYGTLAVFCKTYLAADVYAVDLFDHYYPKNLFDRLKINFKRMNVELEPLNFKNNFDVVILTEVLEHFNFHPVPTLKRIRDVMKDNAVLYLTTPNAAVVGKITTHYNHLKDIPMPNNNTCIHDEHIWQYNIDELVSVINASGLMVTNIDTSNDGQQFNLAIMKRG